MNDNTVDQVYFSRRITKEEATELVLNRPEYFGDSLS